MKFVTVISPSGNFYGSEQVLFDFLCSCNHRFIVEVPNNSTFSRVVKLHLASKHILKKFANVQNLYIKLFFRIALGKCKGIYCNEGGHINWIYTLALLFPKIIFICHIRIYEDIARIPSSIPKNLLIVTISNFMKNEMPSDFPKFFFYDPYNFQFRQEVFKQANTLHIGIVGRISRSKGLYDFISFLNLATTSNTKCRLFFHFFGTLPENNEDNLLFKSIQNKFKDIVYFHGFKSKTEIYSKIDAVLHLATREPLGRIFFEAIENTKPIIGFRSGGIGELMLLSGLEEFLINRESSAWEAEILDKLVSIEENYDQTIKTITKAQVFLEGIFNQNSYNSMISTLLNL